MCALNDLMSFSGQLAALLLLLVGCVLAVPDTSRLPAAGATATTSGVLVR